MDNIQTQQTKSGLVGIVTSTKMQKSIVVAVERLVQDKRYYKQIKRTSKFHVHDEEQICQVGDEVLIFQCRPISKMKAWTLGKVLKKANVDTKSMQ